MNDKSTISIGQYLQKLWRKRVPVFVVVPIVVAALLPTVISHFQTRSVLPTEGDHGKPHVLGIKDLVQEVRAELAAVEADVRNKGEMALFELAAFDMELKFLVSADSTVTSGINTKLVTAESDIRTGSEKVQTLSLHWKAAKPVDFEGKSEPSTLEVNNQVGVPPPAQK